jgi:hypothetical protein
LSIWHFSIRDDALSASFAGTQCSLPHFDGAAPEMLDAQLRFVYLPLSCFLRFCNPACEKTAPAALQFSDWLTLSILNAGRENAISEFL